MTFDNYLFRCSSLGKLMTEPRNKSETLSETTKSYLKELFIKEYFGREKELDNKYLQKGIACEQDSLALLSDIRGVFIKKNKEWFTNDKLSGTPDVLIDDEVEDIKTNWDLFTFINAEVSKDYDWQLEGYCLLTGATKKRLTYTLVNTPDYLIEKEKKSLTYKYDVDSPSFTDACKQLEINSIFDLGKFMKDYPDFHFHNNISDWNFDIPKHNRVKSFEIERQPQKEIEKLYFRTDESRKFLNNLVKQFKK